MTKPEYETSSWTDVLGQTYGPGDCVCYAVINGRSAQQVIGEVVAIYTHNGQGERYTTGWGGSGKPSVSVKILPLLDARGFWRDDNPRPVHIKIPENIIKIPNELKPKPKAVRVKEKNVEGVTKILQDLLEKNRG